MSLSLRNLLTSIVLAAAAGASWYWSRAGTGIAEPGAARDARPLGYYLTGAEILRTDENGRVLYKIWARQAEELPDEGRLILSDVRVEYRPVENVPWLLTADTGEAPVDQSYFDLSGAVELANEPGGSSERTTIRTEALRFEPESFVASTAADVSLFVGDGRLDAVGARVYLRDDRLELESRIHGEFEP